MGRAFEQRSSQPAQLRGGQGGLGLQEGEAEYVESCAHRRSLARGEAP
jgi:hypothetical protein